MACYQAFLVNDCHLESAMDVFQMQPEGRCQVVEPANAVLHATRRPTHSSFITTVAPMTSSPEESYPDLVGDAEHGMCLFSVAKQPDAFE